MQLRNHTNLKQLHKETLLHIEIKIETIDYSRNLNKKLNKDDFYFIMDGKFQGSIIFLKGRNNDES